MKTHRRLVLAIATTLGVGLMASGGAFGHGWGLPPYHDIGRVGRDGRLARLTDPPEEEPVPGVGTAKVLVC